MDSKTIIKNGLIYQIKFPNGKSYVGRSIKPMKRLIQRYLVHEINGVRPVNRAIKSFGINTIIFVLIEEFENVSDAYLSEREIFWIKELKTIINENGYNLTEGGRNCDNFKYSPKRESYVKKLKERLKENHPMFGKKHSKESLNLMSIAHKKHIAKYGAPMLGKTFSISTKLKMSKNRKGKYTKENNPKWKGYPDKQLLNELIINNNSVLEIRKKLNITQKKLYESLKFFYKETNLLNVKKLLNVKEYSLTKEEIIDLINKGFSKRKITRDYKISNKTINKLLKS
jgi:group I intron endonuclease